MVEEHNTSQDMGKIFSRGMLHQGSSSINRERVEMNFQGKKMAQTFEDQMLQFMGENKKLLNFHEQKFAELEASNSNSQIF